MAKKTRKQKQRAATRRPGTPAPATPGTVARQALAPAPAPQRAVPATPRPFPAKVVPESILPLPGGGPEIESEPADDERETVVAVADASARRRVQRVNPAAQPRAPRGQLSAAAMFLPLESEDAAIPFDRVPYVPRDLRRVAIMAVLMIVLILIAAFVVTRINP